jgi:hypothetical protein
MKEIVPNKFFKAIKYVPDKTYKLEELYLFNKNFTNGMAINKFEDYYGNIYFQFNNFNSQLNLLNTYDNIYEISKEDFTDVFDGFCRNCLYKFDELSIRHLNLLSNQDKELDELYGKFSHNALYLNVHPFYAYQVVYDIIKNENETIFKTFTMLRNTEINSTFITQKQAFSGLKNLIPDENKKVLCNPTPFKYRFLEEMKRIVNEYNIDL